VQPSLRLAPRSAGALDSVRRLTDSGLRLRRRRLRAVSDLVVTNRHRDPNPARGDGTSVSLTA